LRLWKKGNLADVVSLPERREIVSAAIASVVQGTNEAGGLLCRYSDGQYFALTGHHLEHYLRNWVLITAGLFLGSGVIYAARVSRLRRCISRSSSGRD
jgi:hypothetical protein